MTFAGLLNQPSRRPRRTWHGVPFADDRPVREAADARRAAPQMTGRILPRESSRWRYGSPTREARAALCRPLGRRPRLVCRAPAFSQAIGIDFSFERSFVRPSFWMR